MSNLYVYYLKLFFSFRPAFISKLRLFGIRRRKNVIMKDLLPNIDQQKLETKLSFL